MRKRKRLGGRTFIGGLERKGERRIEQATKDFKGFLRRWHAKEDSVELS